MPSYKAPLEDVRFLLNDVFQIDRYNNLPGFSDASPDMREAILSEAARLSEEVLQPLNRVGDLPGFLAQQRCVRRLPAKIRRRRGADRGIEPVVERHAGAARGRLGPLAHGWIDAVDTPRYARIHDLVRFRLRRSTCATASPRVPIGRQSNSVRVVCLRDRLFPGRVNIGLRNAASRP